MNLPFRIRAKIFRQRIILTVRYWFHLPQDDLKDQYQRDEIEGLVKLNEQAATTIRTLALTVKQLDARLKYHEDRIPRMRDNRQRFDQEQAGFRQADAQAMKERLEHGIVGGIRH